MLLSSATQYKNDNGEELKADITGWALQKTF